MLGVHCISSAPFPRLPKESVGHWLEMEGPGLVPISCNLGLDLKFPCTSYLRKLERVRLDSKENLLSCLVGWGEGMEDFPKTFGSPGSIRPQGKLQERALDLELNATKSKVSSCNLLTILG